MSRRALLTGAAGAAVVLGGGGVLAKHEIDMHPSLRRLFHQCGSMPSLPSKGGYAVLTDTYRSTAMGRDMPYAVAAPSEGFFEHPLPLILALPGDGGSATDFADDIGLPNYANHGGLQACFVSPGDVDSSYYHPRRDGTDMAAFLLDELIPHVERREGAGGSGRNRAVYGVSMGGYGALRLAQERPDFFCAAVAESPAVFQTYHDAITGHSHTFDSEADWERYGVWPTIDKSYWPPVRIDCGDADPFAATARQLLDRIPHAVGEISSGCHEHGFWRRRAPEAIAFLKSRLSSH